jgi:hypothetical protein
VPDALTRRTFDRSNPRSLSARARGRRWAEFMRRFPAFADMKVLDLGGTPEFWQRAPLRPAAVTIVNLLDETVDESWITTLHGDACDAGWLTETFDVVISNSLLEHVGGVARRRQLADVVHAAAPRWWMQTPYRYFPVEPHWMCPGFQFLPLPAKVALTRRWPLGHRHEPDPQLAYELATEVELITITELRHLFPEGGIWRERMGGLVKSITAVRT